MTEAIIDALFSIELKYRRRLTKRQLLALQGAIDILKGCGSLVATVRATEEDVGREVCNEHGQSGDADDVSKVPLRRRAVRY
jgi:hypothetical protein